jgi:hypothetical protein
VNRWRQRLRHLDHAVDAEIIPRTLRKDDGQAAINELAGLGCRLLEMGVEVLGEVPEFDRTELEVAVLAVMTSLGNRLAEPPEPVVKRQQTARVLRLGGLSITVATERALTDEPTG